MLRSMLAIAAGYASIAILNSFVHLIVSVYFKKEIFLTGVAQLPSNVWVLSFTALQFALGLFGGLLTTTLAKSRAHIEILGFILLMIIIGFVDYSMLAGREPLWYLISSPLLIILGIFAGYRLQQIPENKTAKEQ